jgi:hypothetical protein
MSAENLTDVLSGDQTAAATAVVAYQSGLVVRYRDESNYFLLQFGFDGAVGRLGLYRKEAGEFFPLDRALTPVAAGDRFELRALGPALAGFKNGERLVGAVDGHFLTETRCGTYRGSAPNDVLADFAAAALLGGPPPPVEVKLGPVPAYYPFDRYANDG